MALEEYQDHGEAMMMDHASLHAHFMDGTSKLPPPPRFLGPPSPVGGTRFLGPPSPVDVNPVPNPRRIFPK